VAGWPHDVVVLGYTGRLAHIKGPDVLLRAVARLHTQTLPVRLVIVGEGAEEASLKALTQQLGIRAITHFSGRLPRAEIYGAIKGFDIAAVPSREEGFGLSALEAMAAGVPVVATQIDALQEVVPEGVTGLLCRVSDPASLADALTRLVSDVALRQKLGAAGVAHVSRLYDAPAYRARLDELLVDLELPAGSAI
jgi:glycosyltransferase involved in cell wall biosynthesis